VKLPKEGKMSQTFQMTVEVPNGRGQFVTLARLTFAPQGQMNPTAAAKAKLSDEERQQKLKDSRRKYYDTHREKLKADQRKYYAENKETLNAKAKVVRDNKKAAVAAVTAVVSAAAANRRKCRA